MDWKIHRAIPALRQRMRQKLQSPLRKIPLMPKMPKMPKMRKTALMTVPG